MQVPYRVYSIDLTNATPSAGAELVAAGQTIGEVALFQLPANASVELAFGRQDFFNVATPFKAEPTGHDEGIFYRNLVPQPGVVLQFVVVWGTTKLSIVQQ